jgi:eukaryotic-like serine/threonine-protein kinase
MDAQQIAVRLYNLTLWCFPAEHRAEWDEVMVATFEAMVCDAYDKSGIPGLVTLWLMTFFDTLKVSVAEHLANYRRGHSIMTELTHINNYRVQNMLGIGGAATVYRVKDNQGKTAILKLFNQPGKPYNYDREFQNLGRINHPTAPRLLDSGTYGVHKYCIIEFIDGESLEAKLQSADPISEHQALEWAIQVCDFLSYIHNLQTPLIHRALKPAKMMLQDDGKVRILDYDSMAELNNQKQDALCHALEGYAAPEQYLGCSDPRSDIYALGASLYHLLTKRNPNEGAPFLFHLRPPRSINPDISEAVEMVILKAVEHKPNDRYQSALAMRVALEDCLFKIQ